MTATVGLLAQIRQQIDYERFFSDLITLSGRGEWRKAFCPFHENRDTEALRLNVEGGFYKCMNPDCDVRGDFVDFYMRMRNLRFREAVGEIAGRLGLSRNGDSGANGANRIIDEAIVVGAHERLLNDPERMRWLKLHRGLDRATVVRWRLGHDGDRYFIPISDELGRVVNIRRYKPGATGADKVISWRRGFGSARLWPFDTVFDRRETVHLFEGEMDCLLALQNGLPAMTSTGGAGTWRDGWTSLFWGRDVVVCYDVDDAGRAGAAQVAANLSGIARSVRVVNLPLTEPPGADFTDYIHGQGRSVEDYLALVEATTRVDVGDVAAEDDPRPRIEIRPRLNEVTDEALQALAARPDLAVYVRGRLPVTIARDGTPPDHWVVRLPGSPEIVPITHALMLSKMDSAARWVKLDRRINKLVPANPPEHIARQILARLDWPLPYLEGIVDAPVIRLDGSILDQPGHDAATSLLYAPAPGEPEYPAVPDHPTQQDVTNAIEVLLDPVAQFPFCTDTDRTNVLAAILTLRARHLIRGHVPAFAIQAPGAGTGKTLLAKIIGLEGTGRLPASMTMPGDGDELRKRILALALAGDPLVLLDNVSGSLGSDTLAATITTREVRDRLLGVSQVVQMPNNAVWLITGNNVAFKKTLARRVIPIWIDTGTEHPEEGRAFTYPNLEAHVQAELPRLIVASLTILRGFILAGRPAHGGERFGSFEVWDDLVRSCLLWAGCPDPISTADERGGRGRLRAEGDEDAEKLELLLEALVGAFYHDRFTTHEVMLKAEDDSELRAVLDTVAPLGHGRATAATVGYALRGAVDRPCGGSKLVRVRRARSGAVYRVEIFGG